MAREYLDKAGLTYFWSKIKNYIDQKGSGATLDQIYPVGSIYMSVNSTSPATLFGGTWEPIKDKFLLSAGDTYSAGAEDGAASRSYTPAGTVGSHTLTAAESGMPSHGHGFTQPTVNGGAVTSGITGGSHYHSTGAIFSDGTGSANAYVMSTNRTAKARDTTSTTHTHNLPSHTHTVTNGKVSDASAKNATSGHNHGFTGTAATIDTMPPYLAVYVWKRTA